MSWTLAVDFGTSNTAAAVRRADDVRPLHLSSQGFTMPSAVALVDGRFRVGTAALNARLSAPESFEWQPKALLGGGPVLLGDRTFPPSSLVAEVLSHVYDVATSHGGRGEAPARTVLTHPVAWSERQIGELVEAATKAGFDRSTMMVLNEPVAAAMHDAGGSMRVGERLAVIDWGGGTCDVAIVEYQPSQAGGFVVRSFTGDPHLGGNHLDVRLYDHVIERLKAEGHATLIDRLNDPSRLSARLTLADVVKRAKEDLSSYETVSVPVQAGGDEAILSINRTEYEDLIAEEITRVVDLLKQATDRDRGSAPNRIVLTGGASQTPALAAALRDHTDTTLERRGDPKLVVAEGALAFQRPQAPRAQTPAPPRPAPAPAPVQAPPRTAPAASDDTSSRGRPGLLIASIAGVALLIGVVLVALWQTGGTSDEAATVCWNGEEVDAESECPEFQGDAAQAWAYPVDEQSDADCEFRSRLWECTWSDAAASTFLVQDDEGAELDAEAIRGEARLILDDSIDDARIVGPSPLEVHGERVGTSWNAEVVADGVDVMNMTFYEYDDLPYRGMLYTEASNLRGGLTTAEQQSHQTLVSERITMRSATEIERTAAGSDS